MQETTSSTRLRSSCSDERGQTSAEYVGALALVLVLAAALSLVIGTSIGEAVVRGASRGICRVVEAAGFGNGGCPSGGPTATPRDYVPDKCVVSSGESKVAGSVTLFSVRVGGDAGYVLEHKSDKKWYLTVKGGIQAGGEAVFGPSGGPENAKQGASGSGYVVAKGEGAVTYRFDTKEQAEAELDKIKEDLKSAAVKAAEGYLEGSAGPLPFGGAIGFVRGALDGPHKRPPSYETSFGAGVEGMVGGEAGSGGSVSGKATGSQVVGVKFGRNDTGQETRTVFFKVNRSAELSGGAPFTVGLTGSGEGEGQVALTYTRTGNDWKPTNVELRAAMRLSGGVNVTGEVKDLRGLQQSLKKVAVGGSDEVGLAGVLTANYDLTDPRTRAAIGDALATVGIHALSDRPTDLAATPSALADAFGTYKNLSFVTYDTTKTTAGGGFKVGDLIAFGAEGSYTRKESELRNARYLTPDGWREWVSCAP